MKGPVEFWKKHPDIDGIEVSSFGRVRSAKGHYYKRCPINSGYLLVQFHVNRKRLQKLIHRLVAQTFIPNPNNLPQVNHKDGDRTNNNASNLEWVTHSYNMKYREKFGEPASKPVFVINFSTLEVSRFPSRIEASRMLGIHVSRISSVVSCRNRHIHGLWFVNDDDNAVDITKNKLHDLGKTRLTAADTVSADFVSQVLAE